MKLPFNTRAFGSTCLFAIALCCCSSFAILAQQPKKKTEKSPAEDTKLAQQQELIGRLVSISNELKGEADKSAAGLLQSEVADVLWRFDEPSARSIFRLAFDNVRQEITNSSSSSEATSGKDSLIQSRQRTSAIRVILKRYGLHDRKGADAWLQEFENDVKSKQAPSNNSFRISPEQAELLTDIALGMLSQNPAEAQRLGLLSLSAMRIPSGFGRLLMGLRDRNKALSDVLFRQALLSLRSNGFPYDRALISLTNYIFFSDGARFPDVSPADVALIVQYFIDAAGAQSARSQSGTIRTGEEQSSLGSFYSFLSNRASRIVALNAPDKSALLQSNIRDMAQALTIDQRQQAELLASVAQPNSNDSLGNDSDTESRIHRAAQEKDVTRRGFLLRSVALQLMRSEPERALEVARKIDDQELRAQTEDDIYLVLMRQAFDGRADAEARSIAVKFNDLSRRARWLAQIAGSLSPPSKDNTEAAELLSEAHSIAAKTENTPAKIEVLLLIAKEFLRIDQERGFEVLSEAVGTTNRVEKVPAKANKSNVPFIKVISMTVVGGQEVSTDDRVTLDSIDFNQIGAFVERDYLRTSFLGNEVKDRLLRSKYFIALARKVLQVPRQGSGYERTLEDLISN
jgi:hypothetical protein